MRYFVLSLVMCVIFSCEKDDTSESLEITKVLGDWKLIREQYSIGGPPFWTEVEDGQTLRFNDDRTFLVTDKGGKSISGRFNVQNDSLMRTYSNDPEKINYISGMELKEDKLILWPLSPSRCIEGCAFEYRRVD